MAQVRYRFKQVDVDHVYRLACRDRIAWEEILPASVHRMLQVMKRSSSCPEIFVLTSALGVTASLCGPNTRMNCHPNTNPVSLNLFFLSISAPGGGKSATYDNVIAPGLKVFNEETGLPLGVETYTQAGLQSHQVLCQGYGLLTSDEGVRILSQIHGKQLKNEGERQFLCKTWTGKGDVSMLREKQRGYEHTSLSMILFVQPQPFMGEMRHFEMDDGLLDRSLFNTSLPHWYTSDIIAKNGALFIAKYKNVFHDAYLAIYKAHADGETTYQFSEDAQKRYNEITDEYVYLFNKRYESEEEDQELHGTPDLSPLEIVSSKDSVQLAKLSVGMHVLMTSLQALMDKTRVNISRYVSLSAVESAQLLYTVMIKQRSVFIQAMNKVPDVQQPHLPKLTCLKDKVLRAMYRMYGPMCYPRLVNKQLKTIPARLIKEEMQRLSEEGRGTMMNRSLPTINRDVFFKPIPDSLSLVSDCWDITNMTHHVYQQRFNEVANYTKQDFRLLKHHPHYEELPFNVAEEVSDTDDERDMVMVNSRIASSSSQNTQSQSSTTNTQVNDEGNESSNEIRGPPGNHTISDSEDDMIPSTQPCARLNKTFPQMKTVSKPIPNTNERQGLPASWFRPVKRSDRPIAAKPVSRVSFPKSSTSCTVVNGGNNISVTNVNAQVHESGCSLSDVVREAATSPDTPVQVNSASNRSNECNTEMPTTSDDVHGHIDKSQPKITSFIQVPVERCASTNILPETVSLVTQGRKRVCQKSTPVPNKKYNTRSCTQKK